MSTAEQRQKLVMQSVSPATEVGHRVKRFATLAVANRVSKLTGGIQVNHLKNFLCDERGAELAEYAVGTAILVAVAIIVYKVLGDAVNVKMSTVANEVQK